MVTCKAVLQASVKYSVLFKMVPDLKTQEEVIL